MDWQLLQLVPSTTGDFTLRFALAAVMVVIAIRRRWGWLAYVAATIAVPTLWLARLAPLVGVPRLWWEERRDAEALATQQPAESGRMGPAPVTT